MEGSPESICTNPPETEYHLLRTLLAGDLGRIALAGSEQLPGSARELLRRIINEGWDIVHTYEQTYKDIDGPLDDARQERDARRRFRDGLRARLASGLDRGEEPKDYSLKLLNEYRKDLAAAIAEVERLTDGKKKAKPLYEKANRLCHIFHPAEDQDVDAIPEAFAETLLKYGSTYFAASERLKNKRIPAATREMVDNVWYLVLHWLWEENAILGEDFPEEATVSTFAFPDCEDIESMITGDNSRIRAATTERWLMMAKEAQKVAWNSPDYKKAIEQYQASIAQEHDNQQRYMEELRKELRSTLRKLTLASFQAMIEEKFGPLIEAGLCFPLMGVEGEEAEFGGSREFRLRAVFDGSKLPEPQPKRPPRRQSKR